MIGHLCSLIGPPVTFNNSRTYRHSRRERLLNYLAAEDNRVWLPGTRFASNIALQRKEAKLFGGWDMVPLACQALRFCRLSIITFPYLSKAHNDELKVLYYLLP